MGRIALDLGFIQIYWYSIFIFLGVFIASCLILLECKKQNINENFIINLIFYTVICGLIGARVYYVLFNLDYYRLYPFEILEIWNGGLAIHGGIIGGLLCMTLYCKKYNAKLLKVFDITVVGLIIGQAIGRWGNFFNQEAYGNLVTKPSLQWFPYAVFIQDYNAWFQATFFYESLWNAIGLAILLVVYYKTKTTGLTTASYLIWEGVGRMWIEGLRSDSLYIAGTNIRVSQLLSGIMLLIGLGILIYHFVKYLLKRRGDNEQKV